MNSSQEKGSVLVYILIAVSLLAALSFAVSKGQRGSATALTEQQAKIAANEIINYGNTVTKAVQKLKLRGCTETQISFENPIYTVYTNPSAPADKHCHVFDLAGGSLTYTLISDSSLEPAGNGHSEFQASFQMQDVGSGATDLIQQINFLKKEVCLEINKKLGVSNPSDNPPVDNNDAGNGAFIGVYHPPKANTIGDDAGSGLAGKTIFCRYQSSVPHYQFNQVLITR